MYISLPSISLTAEINTLCRAHCWCSREWYTGQCYFLCTTQYIRKQPQPWSQYFLWHHVMVENIFWSMNVSWTSIRVPLLLTRVAGALALELQLFLAVWLGDRITTRCRTAFFSHLSRCQAPSTFITIFGHQTRTTGRTNKERMSIHPLTVIHLYKQNDSTLRILCRTSLQVCMRVSVGVRVGGLWGRWEAEPELM